MIIRRAIFLIVVLLLMWPILSVQCERKSYYSRVASTKACIEKLEAELKNARSLAQAYLTTHPGEALDQEGKLKSAGWMPKRGISFVRGNLTQKAGEIVLKDGHLSEENALPAKGLNSGEGKIMQSGIVVLPEVKFSK
jgi:hypothetical protein